MCLCVLYVFLYLSKQSYVLLIPLYRYSLYEPNDNLQLEYKGGLEKAIHINSTLVDQLNDAFSKTHPWLAQKALTRAGCVAVSKISGNALLTKTLQLRRQHAGSLLKTVRDINALKLTCSDLLHGERNHSSSSEPYFYDTSYTHAKLSGPIPVDLQGRCVVTEEIGDRDAVHLRPLKWKCTKECRLLGTDEVDLVLRIKSVFQACIEDIRLELDNLDSGCSYVHHDDTTELDNQNPRYSVLSGHPICCERATQLSSKNDPNADLFVASLTGE